jgi:hypothetical protein
MLGWVIFGVGTVLSLLMVSLSINDIVVTSSCEESRFSKNPCRNARDTVTSDATILALMVSGTILMVTGLLIELSNRPALASVFGGRRRW